LIVLLLIAAAASSAVALALRDRGTRRTPTAPAKAGTSRSGSRPETNVVGPVRERTFGWAAVPHATAYDVRFFRGGRQIFGARASSPRLVLPVFWRYHGRKMVLRPGRYTWTVQPLFRGRRGSVMIRAVFVLKRG
jgi:hypothetical protein